MDNNDFYNLSNSPIINRFCISHYWQYLWALTFDLRGHVLSQISSWWSNEPQRLYHELILPELDENNFIFFSSQTTSDITSEAFFWNFWNFPFEEKTWKSKIWLFMVKNAYIPGQIPIILRRVTPPPSGKF